MGIDKRKTTLKLALAALFAALTCAGTFIALPLPGSPVPVVLQNFFVLLGGLVLGPVLGSAAAAAYLVLGAIGLPVFAGAKGGFVHFFGPTGGYLAGYLVCALVAGLIAGAPIAAGGAGRLRLALAGLAGFALIYALGVARLKYAISASWPKAVALGLIPYLIGDALKLALAVAVAPRLRRAVARAFDD